jgi:hypothetical protein
MPQSNMKRSVVQASKGDEGTKEAPSVEPQGLLGNVFQRVMNLISGGGDREEEECMSDTEAPSIVKNSINA